jgi:hypothetical protein
MKKPGGLKMEQVEPLRMGCAGAAYQAVELGAATSLAIN